MPIRNIEDYLENSNKQKFSNRTYNDFLNELLNYASEYYKDVNKDFSDSSFGGMLLDFAAIVGDSLMFYAEQQFNELNYDTAVDIDSINYHLKKAGVKNIDASPSSVEVTFELEVPIDNSLTDYNDIEQIKPNIELLPVIKSGTSLVSDGGIPFVLLEDVDFMSGYVSEVGDVDENEIPVSLFLSKKGLCSSGIITSESVFFERQNNLFLSYRLENENVTNIISVVDEDLNEYYEVDYLTQNTIFKKYKTIDGNHINVAPAMRRFIVEKDINNNTSTLRFGNGNGKVLKDDVLSNPSELFLPIKNKDYINRLDIDPSKLLESDTLGVSPSGKTLTITYKYSGGDGHNVKSGTINEFLNEPIVIFPNSTLSTNDSSKNNVVNSISITNESGAIGGANPLDINVLKLQIPQALNMQSRIITYEDLISRILTMPSDFGRIHKAIALENKNTNSSKDIFILCKDNNNFYINASDAIKKNLSKYLNEYRLIGDSYNILDVPVYNFGISAQVRFKPSVNIEDAILDISELISRTLRFDTLNIGEPIDSKLIAHLIETHKSVIELITPRQEIIISKTDVDSFYDPFLDNENTYQNNKINPVKMYKNGLVFPPRGGIFEMRYSSRDIRILAN